MDIYSIYKKIKTSKSQDGLYDLFDSYIFYRPDIPLYSYEVQQYDEMRIDLIFQNIYRLEPNEVGSYLENIDVLLFINFIDNPINIKRGTIIRYPDLSELSSFRYNEDALSATKRTVKPLLAVPNVSTKKDSDREKYKKANYSLPPVALETPKSSVRIEDGVFKVGGL
jgi:hypothetical protein